MSETRPDRDAETELEHTADELDDRLHRLEDHLDEAEQQAQQRRADLDPDDDEPDGD